MKYFKIMAVKETTANTIKQETDSLGTNICMVLWKSWIVKSISEIVCCKPSLLSYKAQEICSNRLFLMTQGQKSAVSFFFWLKFSKGCSAKFFHLKKFITLFSPPLSFRENTKLPFPGD